MPVIIHHGNMFPVRSTGSSQAFLSRILSGYPWHKAETNPLVSAGMELESQHAFHLNSSCERLNRHLAHNHNFDRDTTSGHAVSAASSRGVARG